MAVKDLKKYYLEIVSDYLVMKSDLEEFTKVIGKYNVTEERVASLKAQVDKMAENVDRLSYVMFLLDMPGRDKKKPKWKKQHKQMNDYLVSKKADKDSVILENKCCLSYIKSEIEKIKNEPAK